MRIIYLALVVFAFVLALGIVSAARSSDPAPQRVSLALKLPKLDRARHVVPIRSPREAPLQFGGQCSQDSNCGTGHKCCSPSNCLDCFKVVTFREGRDLPVRG